MDPLKILSDLRQLASDIRSKAGAIKIMRDVVALEDDGLNVAEAIMALSGPDAPSTPSPAAVLHAKVGAVAALSREGLAAEIDQLGDDAAFSRSKVPAGQVGSFGDAGFLKDLARRLAPLVIQALMVALTGA